MPEVIRCVLGMVGNKRKGRPRNSPSPVQKGRRPQGLADHGYGRARETCMFLPQATVHPGRFRPRAAPFPHP